MYTQTYTHLYRLIYRQLYIYTYFHGIFPYVSLYDCTALSWPGISQVNTSDVPATIDEVLKRVTRLAFYSH